MARQPVQQCIREAMGQHVRHRTAILRFGEQPERPVLHVCCHGGVSRPGKGPEYLFSPFTVPMTFIVLSDRMPPSFGPPRIVCTKCGTIGADVRPNWKEQPQRESLTGKQWRSQ
jgi:hypothetical protein